MLTIQSKLLLSTLLFMSLLLFAACSSNSTGDDVEEDDGLAPSPISSLAIVSFTDTSVTLTWIAPGDDSTSGTADHYDLRCSDSMITFDNFVDADQITYVPAPQVSGTVQFVEVIGLTTNTRYYFSIIAFDENANYSYPSNVVSAVPFVDVAISFADAAIEAAVRSAISKPTGTLMRSDVIEITEIFAEDAGVTELDGLEYCESLRNLRLIGNSITDLSPLEDLTELRVIDIYGSSVSDLSPLSGLYNLEQLNLGGNNVTNIAAIAGLTNLMLLRLHENAIVDFSPIASLTLLTYLDLHGCQVSGIGFVTGLTNLEWLQLYSNNISDIQPLSGLTALRELSLAYNNVSDIAPLSGLTNLEFLGLIFNQIVDISPLVSNNGIGSGDEISLDNNPLSQTSINTHIPALQARGVSVSY